MKTESDHLNKNDESFKFLFFWYLGSKQNG